MLLLLHVVQLQRIAVKIAHGCIVHGAAVAPRPVVLRRFKPLLMAPACRYGLPLLQLCHALLTAGDRSSCLALLPQALLPQGCDLAALCPNSCLVAALQALLPVAAKHGEGRIMVPGQAARSVAEHCCAGRCCEAMQSCDWSGIQPATRFRSFNILRVGTEPRTSHYLLNACALLPPPAR